MRTEHQQRVYDFMVKAGQETPDTPCIPDEKTRLLRAKLIFEEAMETIQALGFGVRISGTDYIINDRKIVFEPVDPNGNPYPTDLIEIADGCADLSVVAMGTLIACGIHDKELLEEVDRSNLDKFRGDAHRAEDGKWVKPSDWKAPDIQRVLDQQEKPEDVDLVREALKRGWIINNRGCLQLPGDISIRWAAEYRIVMVDGIYIAVPHWLRQRMEEIANGKPEPESVQRILRAQDDGPDYEHDSENFALAETMTPMDKDKPERETASSLNTRQEYKPAECRACRTPLSQGMVRRIGGTEGIRCPNCLVVLLSKDDVIIYA